MFLQEHLGQFDDVRFGQDFREGKIDGDILGFCA